MTQDELNMRKKLCKKKVKRLQHTAPYLWVCHLQQRRRIVLALNSVKVLLELIKREHKSKRWRRMKHVTGKKRGQNVLSVKVPITDKEGNTTTKECVTQQGIFEAAEPVFLWSFLFIILQ